jgi:hypothetical protein
MSCDVLNSAFEASEGRSSAGMYNYPHYFILIKDDNVEGAEAAQEAGPKDPLDFIHYKDDCVVPEELL